MKIGIDVGGSHIGIGLVNDKGEITSKKEEDLKIIEIKNNEIAKKKIIETLISGTSKLLTDNRISLRDIEMIGISFPGDVNEKCVIKAENLGIKDFNIVEDLNKELNIPVFLKNDAKCAAAAEKSYGSLKKFDDAVFIILGTGVGGAAFLSGKLLVPKRHPGFEFGHTIIEKNGIKCNCGANGCFERYASMKYFKEKIREATKTNLHGKELKEYIKNNIKDNIIEKVVSNYIEYLTIGIANFINIFEPQAVCIGGSFTYYEDILFSRLIENLNRSKIIYNPEELPKIVIAKLQNDAGIIGSTIV